MGEKRGNNYAVSTCHVVQQVQAALLGLEKLIACETGSFTQC